MKNSKKNKAFMKPSGAKQTNFFIHVGAGASISSVAESKVNKGIAGIGAIKKSEKS